MKRAYWCCDCAWNVHRKDWLDEQNWNQWPNLIFYSKNLAGQRFITFTSDSFYTTVCRHHCLCHRVLRRRLRHVYCVGRGHVVALLRDGGVVGHVGDGHSPSERSFFSCSSSRVLLYSSSRRMRRRSQRRPCGLVFQYIARNIGAMVVGNAPYAANN